MRLSDKSKQEIARQQVLHALGEARLNVRQYRNRAAAARRPDEKQKFRGLVGVWQTTARAHEEKLREAGYPVPLCLV